MGPMQLLQATTSRLPLSESILQLCRNPSASSAGKEPPIQDIKSSVDLIYFYEPLSLEVGKKSNLADI